MPMVKVPKENTYLIGTEAKQLTVRGENCMVRVGGGYVTIEEYYNRYSTKQCVALYQLMTSQGTTFLDTIADLMRKNGCSEDQLQPWYAEENFDTANTLFILLATFAEERLKSLNSGNNRRNSSPKKKKKGKKGKRSVEFSD